MVVGFSEVTQNEILAISIDVFFLLCRLLIYVGTSSCPSAETREMKPIMSTDKTSRDAQPVEVIGFPTVSDHESNILRLHFGALKLTSS